MNLPRMLLRHRITVEAHVGVTATGPAYGPPREVACYVEAARGTVRTSDKRTVVGASVVRCQLDRGIGPQARVTLFGRVVEVVKVSHYDGGPATPNHTELTVI